MRLVAQALFLFFELIRELTDQNAYERHLAMAGVPHSAEEWRNFSNHRLAARFGSCFCC